MSPSTCFLCGVRFVKGLIRQPGRSKVQNNPQDDVTMNVWDERCVTSLCQVLRISRGHPASLVLLSTQNEKMNCSACEQLIRNLEFSLQTITKLQEQILKVRRLVFKNLLSKSSNPNKYTKQRPSNDSDEEGFIVLLDKVLEEQSSWTEVDFLSKVASEEVQVSPFKDLVSTEESQHEEIEIKEEFVSPEDVMTDFLILEQPQLSPECPSQSGDPLELPANFVQTCYDDESSQSGNRIDTEESNMEDPLAIDDPDWTMDEEEAQLTRLRHTTIVTRKQKQVVPQYRQTGEKLEDFIKIHVQKKSQAKKKIRCQNKKIASPEINKKVLNLAMSQLKKNIETKLSHENHIVNEHQERREKLLNCKICEKTFKGSHALQKHELVHRVVVDQSKNAIEIELGQEIPTIINQRRRKKLVFKCVDCGKICKDSRALKKHQVVHRRQLRLKTHKSCSFCGIWMTHEEIESHESLHRNREQPFSCLLCKSSETKYLGLAPLNKHMKDVHPDEFESVKNLHKYKCKHCAEEFLLRKTRNVHLKEVHGDSCKEFLCDICGKIFSEKYFVELHKKNIHTEKSDKTATICEVCGKSFSTVEYLNYHKQVHVDELKFKCSFCDKAFKFSKALKKHQQIHAGLEFKCPDCPKVFSTQRYLQQHGRVHLPVEQRKYYYKTKEVGESA